MSKYIRIKGKLNSPRDSFIVAVFSSKFQFAKFFLNAKTSKDRPTVDGKNSAKCGANLLAEHWKDWTPISNVTMRSLWDFADPQGKFYKFHSQLGSVGEASADKL